MPKPTRTLIPPKLLYDLSKTRDANEQRLIVVAQSSVVFPLVFFTLMISKIYDKLRRVARIFRCYSTKLVTLCNAV
jgi:hypothetical protein